MQFVNLTPHSITLVDEIGVSHVFPPSGTVARLKEKVEVLPSIWNFRVVRKSFGEIEGLPEPVEGTIYIVSALVLGQTDRDDVCGVGELIRDATGNIVGAKGLSK